ncbi:hypothetical protein HGI10_66900 [Streptomyces collinus]|nr:hypothetical protein HGI10_66900 [Streptomyces collinus]
MGSPRTTRHAAPEGRKPARPYRNGVAEEYGGRGAGRSHGCGESSRDVERPERVELVLPRAFTTRGATGEQGPPVFRGVPAVVGRVWRHGAEREPGVCAGRSGCRVATGMRRAVGRAARARADVAWWSVAGLRWGCAGGNGGVDSRRWRSRQSGGGDLKSVALAGGRRGPVERVREDGRARRVTAEDRVRSAVCVWLAEPRAPAGGPAGAALPGGRACRWGAPGWGPAWGPRVSAPCGLGRTPLGPVAQRGSEPSGPGPTRPLSGRRCTRGSSLSAAGAPSAAGRSGPVCSGCDATGGPAVPPGGRVLPFPGEVLRPLLPSPAPSIRRDPARLRHGPRGAPPGRSAFAPLAARALPRARGPRCAFACPEVVPGRPRRVLLGGRRPAYPAAVDRRRLRAGWPASGCPPARGRGAGPGAAARPRRCALRRCGRARCGPGLAQVADVAAARCRVGRLCGGDHV